MIQNTRILTDNIDNRLENLFATIEQNTHEVFK